MNETIKRWHEFVETLNDTILDEILDENVKFHSPFVWKPKEGKLMTKAILIAATQTFQNFKYIREIAENNDFMLEFEANIGELTLRGVDIVKLGNDGKIIDFEVMIRPANALQVLGMEMTRRLSEKGLI
ncbi:MAG TPA: hypothetical protein PKY59_09235 [Pyrinomonadaceae bacterium]|nr:hypothetical protein [Pyrinomonadaceae bacterium]